MSNVYIDALAGYSWLDAGSDNHLTYYFDNTGYRAWSANEKAAFTAALQSWADVADLTFSLATSKASAELTEKLVSTASIESQFGYGTVAVHYTPNILGTSSGQFAADGSSLHKYALGYDDPVAGTFVFETFVHELGHALGLAHPHDHGMGTGVFPGVTGPFSTGTDKLNLNIYTVMSYNSDEDAPLYGHVATPMAFDIAAIQQLYGVNTSYHTGNDVYSLNDVIYDENALDTVKTPYWKCLWDAGGNDTIAYTGATGVTIDLRAATLQPGTGAGGYLSGGTAWGGFTIANGVVIENASGGSGNDKLMGNSAANVLTGNDGADRLDGGAGADVLIGGGGNDTYILGDLLDSVRENANQGIDTVFVFVSAILQPFGEVENLYLQTLAAIRGEGNALGNKIIGNAADNTLIGLGGNDILDGRAGHDRLFGGTGDDIYYIGADDDLVSEAGGAGRDTVLTSISRSLSDFIGIENLTAMSNARGEAVDLKGNAAANVLTGNYQYNNLDGLGGADTLIGGGGGDTYGLDSVHDVVIENGGIGEDWVHTANFSITLENYKNIECASLDGRRNFNLTGNDLANYLEGNSGNNVLTGKGGRDQLAGGSGADVFAYLSLKDSGAQAHLRDIIIGFEHHRDKIDLKAIDANTKTAGNDVFKFIGAAGFSGTAGELNYKVVHIGWSNYALVEADVNGDKKADLQIEFFSPEKFSAVDFIL